MDMVFVTHRMTGVHPIPEEWLDGYAPSGFRYATANEVAWWYEERGLSLPPEVEGALRSERSELAEEGTPGDTRWHQGRPYQWRAA